jgi:hypothetical protein
MHKVSRTLLLAGVLAFGTLTAACGDKVTVAAPTNTVGVSSVLVSPPSASVAVGQSITLAASVTADATTAKTVTWTSSTPAVATVDATGKVTGVSAGTATITATATADASKQSASAVTVTASTGTSVPPAVAIASVTDQTGAPVNLANVQGQINVTLNETGGAGNIEVFLAPAANCTTNTIAANDVVVANQATTATQAGTVTLSFNTAQLTSANAPKFINGSYCVKARLTTAVGAAIATNTIPVTLANASFYRLVNTIATSFTTVSGGPTSAVSSLNGLNYNQGTLTVTIAPVNFNTGSQVALISGTLSLNGVQAGAGAAPITFTNVPVTNGQATIVFADTAGAARSIANYTSLPAGDVLTINSATDVAGNSVVANGTVATTIRIDNTAPINTNTTYVVTAPNGYIGAAYKFSSGTAGVAVSDSSAGVGGVGGITTTYFVGAAGSAAFATANSCNVTGLTAATLGTDLANTIATNVDQAKVVVKDALGNTVCRDVPSSFAGGLFGVDKIAPTISDSLVAGVTPATVTKDLGVATTTTNWTFAIMDTISGFNAAPFRGTIVRNFFINNATNTDCVLGVYNATPKTCTAVAFANGVQATNGTNKSGYYTFSANVVDQAGNVSSTRTATAAFDPAAPTLGALTQSPTAVAPLGTVTVSATATDSVDLTSTRGFLTYATASAPFQAVAGTSFGPNFDATFVTSAAASVSLPNVYRSLQSTTAGVIQGNAALPVANLTVTNVGGLTSAASTATIITAPATITNIQAGNGFFLAVTQQPATRVTAIPVIARVTGSSTDPAFQSQPFTQVDFYRLIAGELVLVGTNTLASVADDASGNRTYSYATNLALGTGAAGTYTFVAVGRNAGGVGVITAQFAVTNP